MRKRTLSAIYQPPARPSHPPCPCGCNLDPVPRDGAIHAPVNRNSVRGKTVRKTVRKTERKTGEPATGVTSA